MAYVATGLGFTPDEERSLLSSTSRADAVLERIEGFVEAQEKIRMITIGAAIIGIVYSLAQFGELTARLRAKKAAR